MGWKILLPLIEIKKNGLKEHRYGEERRELDTHFGCARLRCQLKIQAEMSSSAVEENVWSSKERVKLEI